VIAVNRGRLERGEPMACMYGLLGLAYLGRQAEFAEQLVHDPTGNHPPTPEPAAGA
jgi:hypothetical protein